MYYCGGKGYNGMEDPIEYQYPTVLDSSSSTNVTLLGSSSAMGSNTSSSVLAVATKQKESRLKARLINYLLHRPGLCATEDTICAVIAPYATPVKVTKFSGTGRCVFVVLCCCFI